MYKSGLKIFARLVRDWAIVALLARHFHSASFVALSSTSVRFAIFVRESAFEGNVGSFASRIITMSAVAFVLSDRRLFPFLGTRYILLCLTVRFAKIKFLRNNRYPINDRRYPSTGRDRRSFTDQVSENSTEVGSRFFLSPPSFFPSSFLSFLSLCLKCESRNGTFKANFGPVVIISEKESAVPSDTCSSSCLFLFPRLAFALLFRNESRIPSCERRFSRGQCGSALPLCARFVCFVSRQCALKLNSVCVCVCESVFMPLSLSLPLSISLFACLCLWQEEAEAVDESVDNRMRVKSTYV